LSQNQTSGKPWILLSKVHLKPRIFQTYAFQYPVFFSWCLADYLSDRASSYPSIHQL
jgi:hypothetical protein